MIWNDPADEDTIYCPVHKTVPADHDVDDCLEFHAEIERDNDEPI